VDKKRGPSAPYLGAFFWFARRRKNAAADDERNHRGNKNPKLQVLHRGVLRRLTPPLTTIRQCVTHVSRLTSSGIGDIRHDPQRLILAEQLGLPRMCGSLFLLYEAQIADDGEQPLSVGRFGSAGKIEKRIKFILVPVHLR
jgi:hypothetical protein